MKNSLKQLLRTPMKTCLFFLLMTAATALLVLGANLWAQTQAQMDAVEKQFTTLGTVEQLPDYEAPVKTKTLDSLWLGAEETESVYGTVYDESVLDFRAPHTCTGPKSARITRRFCRKNTPRRSGRTHRRLTAADASSSSHRLKAGGPIAAKPCR